MIKVNCEGTTEISGGRTRKLNFTFQVDDKAVPSLLADALKVRFRSKFRKACETMKDGDEILITVGMNGDKVELAIVDERAARRAEIMQALTSGNHNEEEMLALIVELKAI
jgi:sRNA-binding carbon storage regulator CsrA